MLAGTSNRCSSGELARGVHCLRCDTTSLLVEPVPRASTGCRSTMTQSRGTTSSLTPLLGSCYTCCYTVATHPSPCLGVRPIFEFTIGSGIDLRVMCREATSVDLSHSH